MIMATTSTSTTPVSAPATAPSKKSYLTSLGLSIAGIIAICFIVVSAASPVSRQSNTGTTARVSEAASVEVDQPRVKDVEVGTEWYDPNTAMLHLHVWGYPTASNVKWQMRANNDDATITNMPTKISARGEILAEFQGEKATNAVSGEVTTKEIRCIEYRVTPGQSVDHCTFRFRFDPPR